MGIFGNRDFREFDDDDEIDYVDTGEVCFKCGKYNDPINKLIAEKLLLSGE